MKSAVCFSSMVFAVLLCATTTNAAVSGHSLYTIIRNASKAAETMGVPQGELQDLMALKEGLASQRKSSRTVHKERETQARRVFAGLIDKYGDAFKTAFFNAYALPDRQTALTANYPRADRIAMLATMIASHRAGLKYNAAYRKKVEAAADKLFDRPVAESKVDLCINKRNVTGKIRYAQTTFTVGQFSFPNSALPLHYRPAVITGKKNAYIKKTIDEFKTSYINRTQKKIYLSAVKAGHYINLDNDWYSPKEAYPALDYFLTSPDQKPKRIASQEPPAPLGPTASAVNFQDRANAVTEKIAERLTRYLSSEKGKNVPPTISKTSYGQLLTFWKTTVIFDYRAKQDKRFPAPQSGQANFSKATRALISYLLLAP